MNKTTEALKLSEEALLGSGYYDTTQQRKALAAIREARAEQEPVAVVKRQVGNSLVVHITGNVSAGDLLYTRPVRTKDLTGEEIERILTEQPNGEHMNLHWFYNAARAVIVADREKNK